MTLTPERLAELRALAERATLAPVVDADIDYKPAPFTDEKFVVLRRTDSLVHAEFLLDHVRAFDPTTAIALLGALDAARKELEEARGLLRVAQEEIDDAVWMMAPFASMTEPTTSLQDISDRIAALLSRTPEGSEP